MISISFCLIVSQADLFAGRRVVRAAAEETLERKDAARRLHPLVIDLRRWQALHPAGEALAWIGALRPGQWFTLQAFILVTGSSPAYTRNKTQWDCTSQGPNLHWTSDEERYCYSDWQQIVAAARFQRRPGPSSSPHHYPHRLTEAS